MKQYHLISLALIALLFTISSCRKTIGTGPVETENRNVSGFSTVNLSIDAIVNITQDSVYEVEVMAQQNILDLLKTTVSGSELNICYKPNLFVKPTEDVVINIHMPNINAIDISGSGSAHAAQLITTTSLNLTVSGSGKIDLNDIDVSQLKTNISGSGKVSIHAGNATSVNSKISGSGDAYLSAVEAANVTTSTSGSGTTKVWANETLDVEISGSGNVYYRGNPSISKDISGSGKLIHEN